MRCATRAIGMLSPTATNPINAAFVAFLTFAPNQKMPDPSSSMPTGSSLRVNLAVKAPAAILSPSMIAASRNDLLETGHSTVVEETPFGNHFFSTSVA